MKVTPGAWKRLQAKEARQVELHRFLSKHRFPALRCCLEIPIPAGYEIYIYTFSSVQVKVSTYN